MVGIAVGIISFNSMPFIVGAVETMAPYAEQILVADGPVEYWQERGHTQSTDGSLEFLRKRVTLIEGQWEEKDEQHRAYLPYIMDDITHLWIVDPDELYLDRDIQMILTMLDKYDAVRFRAYHFMGGLDQCAYNTLARQRILRWQPGAHLVTSRPPALSSQGEKVLAGKVLAKQGIYMYHYSHVLQHQQERRREYYQHRGIHQPELTTEPFNGEHPRWIEENRSWLMAYDSKSS